MFKSKLFLIIFISLFFNSIALAATYTYSITKLRVIYQDGTSQTIELDSPVEITDYDIDRTYEGVSLGSISGLTNSVITGINLYIEDYTIDGSNDGSGWLVYNSSPVSDHNSATNVIEGSIINISENNVATIRYYYIDGSFTITIPSTDYPESPPSTPDSAAFTFEIYRAE